MAIVLLVEDEEQVRVLAESYLEEQGHEVLSAGTPDGALALLEKTPHVEMLFTDIDLKGDIAAGINLAREAASRWPHLKVLYTTGRGLTDGMKVRFVENSAFLPKPYTVDHSPRCRSISRSAHSHVANKITPPYSYGCAELIKINLGRDRRNSLRYGPARPLGDFGLPRYD